MSNHNNTTLHNAAAAADDEASSSSQSIYFIRHAHKQDLKQPFDDPEHGAKYWSRPCDTPLSEEGTHMADDLGTYFCQHPHQKIDTLLVSPALRCLQTAKPISEACAVAGRTTTTAAAAAVALPMNIEEGLYDVPIGSLLSTASSMEKTNSTTTTTTKPPNAAAWDYPSLPFPSLTERKCYFTNINTQYHSKISVETCEESQYENTKEDHHEFYQQELQAYVSRASRTIERIVKDFPQDNLCIVTHGAHIPIMLATLLQLDMQTTCGTHLGGAMAHMASITRIYRKKETTTDGSWGPWQIDPALANSVQHLTQHQDLLRHKGLPQYGGNPDKLKLYMSILTKEMMKSPWLLKNTNKKNNATDITTPDTETPDGGDFFGVNKSKM